jgi:hypothetical protein
VDAGVLGVEFETHGRIASAVTKTGEFVRPSAKSASFKPFRPDFSDCIGSSPTGC